MNAEFFVASPGVSLSIYPTAATGAPGLFGDGRSTDFTVDLKSALEAVCPGTSAKNLQVTFNASFQYNNGGTPSPDPLVYVNQLSATVFVLHFQFPPLSLADANAISNGQGGALSALVASI